MLLGGAGMLGLVLRLSTQELASASVAKAATSLEVECIGERRQNEEIKMPDQRAPLRAVERQQS